MDSATACSLNPTIPEAAKAVAQLVQKQLGLFQRGKMSAPVQFIPVDDIAEALSAQRRLQRNISFGTASSPRACRSSIFGLLKLSPVQAG